jgi:hypothetical protein
MLIYVIAEERTGSTWLANQLARQLSRTHAYIEMSSDEEVNINRLAVIAHDPIKYSDTKKVYHTHLFPILGLMNRLQTEPVVIRTCRKNMLEQMLSYYMQKKAAENVPMWAKFLPEDGVEAWLANNQITLTKGEVTEYFARKDQRDDMWINYRSPYKQTIYYEDLFNGVEIPALKLTLNFDQPSGYKMNQHYKAIHFTNYNEIRDWADAA